MDEEKFLYKLGFVLVPALILIPRPEGAVFVSFLSLTGLFAAHGLSLALDRVKSLLLKRSVTIFSTVLLVTALCFLSRTYLPALAQAAGFFYPVLLLNYLLVTQEGPSDMKKKMSFWYVSGLIGGSALKILFAPSVSDIDPGAVFLSVGFFLAFIKVFAGKKWITP